MQYQSIGHVTLARDVVAAAVSVWRKLTSGGQKRQRPSKRYTRKAVLPIYLPGLQPRAAGPAPCDIDLPMDPLAQALALGRGFGSVRTSVLQTALEQLRSAEAQRCLTVQGRSLKTLIERQLSSRHVTIDIRAA
jgi:hypothetical protein